MMKFLAGLLSCAALALPAQALEIEYIAHAAFRITTSQGARAVIDPYADKVWISYNFPRGLDADAVFVTHAHYDHDGGFSQGRGFPFPASTPVHLAPGMVRIGDLLATGIASVHAGTGQGGRPEANVMWVLEAEGLRIAHIGDNRRLTMEDLRALGRIDVLLLRRSGTEDTSPAALAELALIRQHAMPRIIIPMHYRLPQFESETSAKGLGTVDAWLALQENVRRQASNTVKLSRATLPRGDETWLLPPSPQVTQ